MEHRAVHARLSGKQEGSRRDAEPLVHKSYADAFEDTELEAVLAERGVRRHRAPGRRAGTVDTADVSFAAGDAD
ncbi:hypothetical protein [Nonomuraea sp. NPDC050786]|uniref:hypothetical protein n=1 Tax=Nonomuraea sp. NPDC050786 TaxID=3154840 RepID=UPI0033DDC7F7